MSLSSRLEARRQARFDDERRRQASAPAIPDDDRWNHHIHYHGLLVDALPAGARRVLDVGCGEGLLTRQLASRVDAVVGMDRDAPTIALARSTTAHPGVQYVVGDLLRPPFPSAAFDAVFCVMALHHVDEVSALRRLADLVRPGGVLGIIGIARSTVADLPWDAAGFFSTRVHRLTKQEWTQPAPMHWPPPTTYRDLRELVASTLPASRYQRRSLFRYTVLWTKDGQPGAPSPGDQ